MKRTRISKSSRHVDIQNLSVPCQVPIQSCISWGNYFLWVHRRKPIPNTSSFSNLESPSGCIAFETLYLMALTGKVYSLFIILIHIPSTFPRFGNLVPCLPVFHCYFAMYSIYLIDINGVLFAVLDIFQIR